MAARGYARNAKKTEAGEEKITLLIPRKEKIKGTLLREREREGGGERGRERKSEAKGGGIVERKKGGNGAARTTVNFKFTK